jgi:hypothetical protein
MNQPKTDYRKTASSAAWGGTKVSTLAGLMAHLRGELGPTKSICQSLAEQIGNSAYNGATSVVVHGEK